MYTFVHPPQRPSPAALPIPSRTSRPAPAAREPHTTERASTGPAPLTFGEGASPAALDFSRIQIHAAAAPALQAQLAVNVPGDACEQEADRIADQVVRAPDSGAGPPTLAAADPDRAYRSSRAGVQGAGGAAPAVVNEVLRSPGQPLDTDTRVAMESRLGHDFGAVRVHTDAMAGRSAHALQARAYTHGRHVVFAPGQFAPRSADGRRLIAHELVHVVQQAGHTAPMVQRQVGGPLDLTPDVCVDVPVLGRACGSDAAKICSQMDLPGCNLVCKVFSCTKPKQPAAKCPSGWKAAATKELEGLCCHGDKVESAQNCCSAERQSFKGCCKQGEVATNLGCEPFKLPGQLCLPPARPTLLGDKCCFPPEVPKGLGCGLLDTPTKPPVQPPTQPPTQPPAVLPQATEIFYKLDRPLPGEGSGSVGAATTGAGKANFDALVKRLKADPTLKVQLVGRGSPEGGPEYNLKLGERRARQIAGALKDAGVPQDQIADPPTSDLASECQKIKPGLVTCGSLNATGERDRQVLARVFPGTTPP
jgi:Domain of unknown function (DUF4157)